jgi:putative ABC transport system substrate-binding protein
MMRRREFITLLGGAAAWPIAVRGQQGDRVRRVGWLIPGTESDSAAAMAALQEALAKLGWIEGRNLRIDRRFAANDPDRIRASAAQLVRLSPDAILTGGGAAIRALQQQTQTIPILFTSGPDPGATGLVRNIARPDANVTGFASLEPSFAGKWLELLKEAAPQVARIAVIFNPEFLTLLAESYFASVNAAARKFGVPAIKTPVRNAVNVVRALDAFAAEPNGGILVLPPPASIAIRDALFEVATEHRLPSIYPRREDVYAGGLLAYAIDLADQYGRAATYVDRLLRGAKVGELPVQFPTKFELVINLKAAKAIGLDVPPTLIARADEVLE